MPEYGVWFLLIVEDCTVTYSGKLLCYLVSDQELSNKNSNHIFSCLYKEVKNSLVYASAIYHHNRKQNHQIMNSIQITALRPYFCCFVSGYRENQIWGKRFAIYLKDVFEKKVKSKMVEVWRCYFLIRKKYFSALLKLK